MSGTPLPPSAGVHPDHQNIRRAPGRRSRRRARPRAL